MGPSPMRNAFTTFPSSRFVERGVVRDALRQCAVELRSRLPQVRSVILFGSYATDRATPRSDADIVVEIDGADAALKRRCEDAAREVFLAAPVPVDAFVIETDELLHGGGVAGAARREGVRLA
jgi:predicted nucleotidyltransferase